MFLRLRGNRFREIMSVYLRIVEITVSLHAWRFRLSKDIWKVLVVQKAVDTLRMRLEPPGFNILPLTCSILHCEIFL